jgi:phytoene dehydrogenase-like protein
VTARIDAFVVGSGPNGLAAAIALAQAGRSVRVLEGADTIGGGTRTQELTLPGYLHDVCSAIHPLALGSPFLSSLPLAEHGLRFAHAELPLAHPLDGGRAVVLNRSIEETAAALGADAGGYRKLMSPLVRDAPAVMDAVLAPPAQWPTYARAGARLGLLGLRSAKGIGRRLQTVEARALLAGSAAHAMRPLTSPATGGAGLVLGLLGHAVGWPVAIGGSRSITAAMASLLQSLGGEIETSRPVTRLADLPASRAVLFDVSARALLAVAGADLPDGYRRALHRYRYGAGVFKLDYALSEPVPWLAPEPRQAGTVHVGGTFAEIAAGEAAVAAGRLPERPFVLVGQQSLTDPSRAPAGRHTLWAYCHVPNGADVDMTEAVERQIERFAPGFRDVVLARHGMGPRRLEAENPNYVGGDINGGAATMWQLLARPTARISPYTTPNPRLLLCSAATPPGGGVHGMCGWHAAQAALRGVLR